MNVLKFFAALYALVILTWIAVSLSVIAKSSNDVQTVRGEVTIMNEAENPVITQKE